MISDIILKVIREDDTFLNSYFEVMFNDGSIVKEYDTNWSAFAKQEEVNYQNKKRTVYTSIYPIKKIKIYHKGLQTELDVPDDHKVYQSMRSRATFTPNGRKDNLILGRYVGLIKDNRIVEERFLSEYEGIVTGYRE